MNTDFRLSTAYFTNMKIQKLGRRCGDGGVLAHVKLLCYAAQHRPSGALTSMDDDDLLIVTGYAGDGDQWLAALLDLGLLDRADDGVLELHDWAEHNPWAAGAEDRTAAGRHAAEARWAAERAKKAAAAGAQQPEGAPPVPPRRRARNQSVNPSAQGQSAPAPMQTEAGTLPDASTGNAETPGGNAEPCAPHQSALPDASTGNAPFLSDSSPTPSLPSPNQPPNPPKPPGPADPDPDGGAPPPDLDPGGLEVLGKLIAFAPDEGQALRCLSRYGPEALRWEIRRLEYGLANRPADAEPVSRPWDYFLSLIGKAMPYAVRLERDEALLLAKNELLVRKHAETEAVVQAINAGRDAASALAAAQDAAFARLEGDPIALEEFEREAQDRALKASKFNRDFHAEHHKLPATVLRPIRNALLAERGLIERNPTEAEGPRAERGLPAPPAEYPRAEKGLRLVDVSDGSQSEAA